MRIYIMDRCRPGSAVTNLLAGQQALLPGSKTAVLYSNDMIAGVSACAAEIYATEEILRRCKGAELEVHEELLPELDHCLQQVELCHPDGWLARRLLTNALVHTIGALAGMRTCSRVLEDEGYETLIFITSSDLSSFYHVLGATSLKTPAGWIDRIKRTAKSLLGHSPRMAAWIFLAMKSFQNIRQRTVQEARQADLLILIGGSWRNAYQQAVEAYELPELHQRAGGPSFQIMLCDDYERMGGGTHRTLSANSRRPSYFAFLHRLLRAQEAVARFASRPSSDNPETDLGRGLLSYLGRPATWNLRTLCTLELCCRLDYLVQHTSARFILASPVYSQVSAAASIVGHERGIPVYSTMVHAVAPYRRSIPVRWPVDGMFTYGLAMNEAMEWSGFPPEKLECVGNISLDPFTRLGHDNGRLDAARKRYRIDKEERLILIGTSGMDSSDMELVARLLCGAREGKWIVAFKKHPHVQDGGAKLMPDNDRLRIVEETDLHIMVWLADLVITDNSSLGIIVLARNGKLAVANFSDQKFPANDYVGDGVAFALSSLDCVASDVACILEQDMPPTMRKCGREAMDRLNFGNDGGAVARMLDAVGRLLPDKAG